MPSLPNILKSLVGRTALPAIYADVRDYLRATPGKPLVVLAVSPVLVTLVMRLGNQQMAKAALERAAPGQDLDAIYRWYFIFVLQIVLLYAIPALIIKFGFREKLSDYGHQLAPVARLWPLLLLFLAVMLPVTYASSLRPTFREFYPLYRGSYLGWGRFALFEVGIFSLFFTQEFFFRGFVIDGLRPHFGMSAILISTAMYGIGHVYKPLPEQLGAFFVGTLLGYIGDRYRTFYFGVIIHYLVAFSMDAYLVVPELLRHGRH